MNCDLCTSSISPKKRLKCERCEKIICFQCRGTCEYCVQVEEKSLEEGNVEISDERPYKYLCKGCIQLFTCPGDGIVSGEHKTCENCSKTCSFCKGRICHYYDSECWFQCSECKKEGCCYCLCEDGIKPRYCDICFRGTKCKECEKRGPNPVHYCDVMKSIICSGVCQKCIDKGIMGSEGFQKLQLPFKISDEEKPMYFCTCEIVEGNKVYRNFVCQICAIEYCRYLLPEHDRPTSRKKISKQAKGNEDRYLFCKFCEALFCKKCRLEHERVHEMNMKKATKHFRFGCFHYLHKNYSLALIHLENAYSLEKSPKFCFTIGSIYEDKTDLKNALKWFNASIKCMKNDENVSENFRLRMTWRRIRCLQGLGDLDKCIGEGKEFLRELNSLDETFFGSLKVAALTLFSTCFLSKNKINTALKHAREACTICDHQGTGLGSQRVEVMFCIGRGMIRFGNFQKAIEILEKAIELSKQGRIKFQFPQGVERMHRILEGHLNHAKEMKQKCIDVIRGMRGAVHGQQRILTSVMLGMQFLSGGKLSGPGSDNLAVQLLLEEIQVFKKRERKRKRKKVQCGLRECSKFEVFEVRFKICSRCRERYYCSVHCQKKDWKGHKKVCGKKK